MAVSATTCAGALSTLTDGSRIPVASSSSRHSHCSSGSSLLSLPPLPLPSPNVVLRVRRRITGTNNGTAPSAGGRIAKSVITMATGESFSSGDSTVDVETELPEILKNIQELWDGLDDKYAVASLIFAAVVALWGSTGLISAIDRLPLIPGVLELVGIGYTGWFIYQNLVFKPDREALVAKIKCTYEDVIGSS